MSRHTQEAVIVNDKQTSDMLRHTQEAVIVNDKQTSDMSRGLFVIYNNSFLCMSKHI
jgi:hypothetical protein